MEPHQKLKVIRFLVFFRIYVELMTSLVYKKIVLRPGNYDIVKIDGDIGNDYCSWIIIVITSFTSDIFGIYSVIVLAVFCYGMGIDEYKTTVLQST